MARSVLRPVHFLFFVLRAGGHNGVQLGILREAVNKRDGGIPEEQQPFAGIGMGHIGVVSPFTQKVEHLRESKGNQKVVGGVRVADKEEQRRFFVPQLMPWCAVKR